MLTDVVEELVHHGLEHVADQPLAHAGNQAADLHVAVYRDASAVAGIGEDQQPAAPAPSRGAPVPRRSSGTARLAPRRQS